MPVRLTPVAGAVHGPAGAAPAPAGLGCAPRSSGPAGGGVLARGRSTLGSSGPSSVVPASQSRAVAALRPNVASHPATHHQSNRPASSRTVQGHALAAGAGRVGVRLVVVVVVLEGPRLLGLGGVVVARGWRCVRPGRRAIRLAIRGTQPRGPAPAAVVRHGPDGIALSTLATRSTANAVTKARAPAGPAVCLARPAEGHAAASCRSPSRRRCATATSNVFAPAVSDKILTVSDNGKPGFRRPGAESLNLNVACAHSLDQSANRTAGPAGAARMAEGWCPRLPAAGTGVCECCKVFSSWAGVRWTRPNITTG